MFIATLFTIERTWKQPKCPLTEEWIKKIPLAKENGYSNVEYYSATKKNKITPSATTWMDLDIVILSEVSQRKKYHLILLTCGI